MAGRSLALLLLLAAALAPASAHPGAIAEGRATCGAEYTDASSAYVIPDLKEAWYIRRIATCEEPEFWVTFDVEKEGQQLYIAAITPELERFKDKLAFNAVLYGPGVSPDQPGMSPLPENLPLELNQKLLGAGAAYLQPPPAYDTCAFVDTNKVMARFSDLIDGRCSEELSLEADHKDRLRAGTTSISHWLYSFNHIAAQPGRYHLQAWLTDRSSGALAQGKFEITLGPWIWYGYASQDTQSEAQAQGTNCICAVNALAYNEKNLDRLGELGSDLFLTELPGGECGGPSAPVSTCFAVDRAPHLGEDSAVEWSGVFDLKGGSTYSWTFHAYADDGVYTYPDPGMNVFLTSGTSAAAKEAANAALSEQNPSVMVGTGETLSVRPRRKQQAETVLFNGVKSTQVFIQPTKDGPVAVFTQHMPSEFMAYFLVDEATGEYIFPSSARLYGGIEPEEGKRERRRRKGTRGG